MHDDYEIIMHIKKKKKIGHLQVEGTFIVLMVSFTLKNINIYFFFLSFSKAFFPNFFLSSNNGQSYVIKINHEQCTEFLY